MMRKVLCNLARRVGPAAVHLKQEPFQGVICVPVYNRALWHMSARAPGAPGIHNHTNTGPCSCGCRSLIHTNGEKELVTFLAGEIASEKKQQKLKKLPKDLEGFIVAAEGSEVTLTRQSEGETITINFNVNHSVDTDVEPEIDPKADNPDVGDLKSKPNFEIDIVRGGKTLSFNCSFTNSNGAENEDGYNDAFCIDEVSYFEGELEDNTYSVAGDVLDGNLYDLFMTILDEKGITNEFVDKLSEISTSHEHSCYISLLEKISAFASK